MEEDWIFPEICNYEVRRQNLVQNLRADIVVYFKLLFSFLNFTRLTIFSIC